MLERLVRKAQDLGYLRVDVIVSPGEYNEGDVVRFASTQHERTARPSLKSLIVPRPTQRPSKCLWESFR